MRSLSGIYKRKCHRCGEKFESVKDYICNECLKLISKDILYRLFIVENKTRKKVADFLGFNERFIKRALIKYDINKNGKNGKKNAECQKGFFKNRCLRCRYFFVSELKENYCDKCIKEIEIKYKDKIKDIDYVQCEICPEKKENLVTHIFRLHNLTSEEYQKIYKGKVICEKLSKKISKSVSTTLKRQWEEGKYNDSLSLIYRDINKLESIINQLSKKIVYVGGSKKDIARFWVRTTRLRNPDFVIIENQEYLEQLGKINSWHEIQDKVSKDFINHVITVNKIIEFNGLHWHSAKFNGKTLEEYTQAMIDDYKSIGIDCLVIWDFELKHRSTKNKSKEAIEIIKNKIEEFVQY